MTRFREDIQVTDRLRLRRRGDDGHWKGRAGAPPIKVGSNVLLTLRREPGGPIVDQREDHNIFVDYGREWISELISLDTGYTSFRDDRVRYIAFGIGGTRQLVAAATIRGTWAGFPNHWGYGTPGDTTTGGYGHDGTPGSGYPAQTDANPEVTGLEYPVQIEVSDYYDNLVVPTTFPEAGTARYTAVLGYNQVSFGAATSVPLSEIGLFTESVPSQSTPPLPQDREVLPSPPIGVRYMIAYNTFDTLSKTSEFVLQVDWELRFA